MAMDPKKHEMPTQDPKVRAMGVKELLNRFEEDNTRKSDIGLTALLNKALQDPNDSIRFVAMSILNSGYATGDELTQKLLTNLQAGNSAYGDDALFASEVKLKTAGEKVQIPDTSPVQKKSEVKSMEFLSYLISGISLGSVYAIIALGYTMVYGIAKMLNFAHGDVIMVGGYISFIATTNWGLNTWLSLLIAMAVCTVLGIVIEGLAYKPLRNATSLAVLITAIGVSYLLQNSALLIWGANPKSYTPITDGQLELFGGQLKISYVTIITVAACIVIAVALTLFTSKTKMGKAMRACSEDKNAARLMGINVNKTISLTFAIGSALAAVAGVLLCSFSPSLMPTTGSMPGIKAFTAAVFGGIGSLPGAMLGGIMLGLIEQFSKTYISTLWADAIVFGVLVVVLIVKPTGLLGKEIREKV